MTPAQEHNELFFVCTTHNGDRFAVADSETYVQVWDWTNGLVGRFSTDYEHSLLSISEDGMFLVTANYTADLITAHEIDTKKILWQRNDLEKCGPVIILNQWDNRVFVKTEEQGEFFLDINTGLTLARLKGYIDKKLLSDIHPEQRHLYRAEPTDFYYENPLANMDLLESYSSSCLLDRKKGKSIKALSKTTFRILDVAFSQDNIFCAYATNPLEAISTKTFKKIWATHVTGHFLRIEYSPELDKVLGIRWDGENGGPKYLNYINVETGVVEKEIILGNVIDTDFLKQGRFLVTTKGQLYSTLTGQQVKQFDFMKHLNEDYPP